MVRKFGFLILFAFVFTSSARADEGMWLPQLLAKLNEDRMKSLGMRISAEDIYSINRGSLKDAIVSFGGFCTGEVISDQGLVLTNHHCGFRSIQSHSTLQNNYIRDGFWAMSKDQEIPNKGLFVTFIVRIDDVTDKVLNGVSPAMTESERQSVIDRNINAVRLSAQKEATHENFVRAFFEGNQYYMFTTETFKDVRLVGAPPSAIGNFGKDTDNWSWPRHTGDFALFRIYASKNNKPAEYSLDNVPYRPKKALTISLGGITEGDFTMVFGFPGATDQYLHSSAVKQIVDVLDPAKINLRKKALDVMDGYMRNDEQIKIQYAAKFASISNYWKKWSGEVLGLKRTGGVEKKVQYEQLFRERINSNPAWNQQYGHLLQSLDSLYTLIEPYALARDYFNEIMSKIELYPVVMNLYSLVNAYDKEGAAGYDKRITAVKEALTDRFNSYDANVDRDLFKVLMPFYYNQPQGFTAPAISDLPQYHGNDYAQLSEWFYNRTILDEPETITHLLNEQRDHVINTIRTDSTVMFFRATQQHFAENIQPRLNELQDQINRLQRDYMKAQMEVMTERKFYPDANRTMRVTYGQVQGYQPRDGVKYGYLTDLDGVMEKYIPGDYEFDVPEKLRQLHANKDYGRYGENGRMPVCFIATNHTTGGNSGSPVLDAYGNLIGLNFDRVWEGTMSDINYDPSICRNIQVDIRYVLFIIDKFANAGHLVDEMDLVFPGKGNKKKSRSKKAKKAKS